MAGACQAEGEPRTEVYRVIMTLRGFLQNGLHQGQAARQLVFARNRSCSPALTV